MRRAACLASIAAACMLAAWPSAAAAASEPQLVERPSRYVDRVSVLPGFDFRGHSKLMLQPSIVSFQGDWLKDMNANRIALLRGTTAQDADDIAREAAKSLDASIVRALRGSGFELVNEPGPGTVTLQPRITDLYVNAPKSVNTQPGRTYTTHAGHGAFALDVRDSTTGRLVVQVADERRIGDRGVMGSSLQVTTPATNAFDFGSAFDDWANGTASALDELRKMPVAASVTHAR